MPTDLDPNAQSQTSAPAASVSDVATKPVDPVKKGTIASVLNLVSDDEVKPESTTVKPAVKPAEKPDAPSAEGSGKPDASKEPVVASESDSSKPSKKVAVKRRETRSVEAEVKRVLAASAPAVTPPAVKPEPAAPVAAAAPETDEGLADEEREELELATYAERKDPGKKGLSEKFRKFYKAQRDFLEKAAAKAETEGESYDPSRDPAYEKFLKANQPEFKPAERKKFFSQRIAEDAKAEALKEAEAKFTPELEKLRRTTRALEHSPRIDQTIATFVDQTAEEMSPEMAKYQMENGGDVNKTRERFPLEFEIVSATLSGARSLAESFLRVRNEVEVFDPVSNPQHQFLQAFVRTQGDVFERSSADQKVRDGKTFIHPMKWKPELANTHWTFGESDVLAMLKVAAQKEAKGRILMERRRLESLGFVPKTPAGAKEPAQRTPAVEVPPSPKAPSSSQPGAATGSAQTPARGVVGMLGL